MKKFEWQIIIFILFWTIGLVCPDMSFAAQNVSRKDLLEVERKAEAQQIEQKRLQAKSLEVSIEMTKLNESMVKAAKQIQANEKSLSQMEDELTRLQNKLSESEEKFKSENKKMAETLAALQNLARKPTEALFVQPLTPVEVIRSAILLREIVPNINQNAENLRKQLKSIASQKSAIEDKLKKIKKQQVSLEDEHKNLKTLMVKKNSMRKDLETKTEISRKKSAELASQASDLRDLVEKIEKDQLEKKRKQEEEKKRLARQRELERQKQSSSQSYAKGETGDLIKNNQDIIKGIGEKFVKAKGLLSRPAAGPVVISYGEETAKGVTSKGITIKTRNLAQIVAPFDGAVVFAGPFRGYGNMIIIEHGKGYLSLLSGLSEMDCEIGQILLAGEPVGQMPANGEAKLYMEIRKDSHPVNPEIWLAN